MATSRRGTSSVEAADQVSSETTAATEKYTSMINDISEDSTKYKFEVTETKTLDSMEPEQCLEVIQKYSTMHNLPLELTIAGITKLIQDGGTNQSKKNLTVLISNKEFELNKLRDILKSIDKTYTVRKFAKGARDIIIKVALINEWPGPLTKELSRVNQNLTITPSLAPWCLEIHSDNYNCPNEIRDALVRREEQLKLFLKTREVPNNKKLKNKSNRPRKGRGGKR